MLTLSSGYVWIILRKTFEKTKARMETINGLIKQVESGEIKFEDDPRDPGAVKDRKLASLKQQRVQSAQELETLILTAITVCSTISNHSTANMNRIFAF
mgnify:CR=1 FL=1